MAVTVAHLMIKNVHFATRDDTVSHVRELMAEKHVHAIPIVGKNRKLEGIVTTADLARKLDDNQPIENVMSDMIATVEATESAGQAARRMRERRIHHLVVSDNGKAVGIVSSYDLLSLFETLPPDFKGFSKNPGAAGAANKACTDDRAQA